MVAAYVADQYDSDIRHNHVNGVEVYAIPVKTLSKKSLEPTRFGLKAFSLIDQLRKEEPFDILQMCGFPNLGLILYPTRRRVARVVILDIRSTGISSRFSNSFSRLVLSMQRRFFSHVTALDLSLAEFLFGDHQDNIIILPLGANFRRFHPGRDVAYRRQLKFSEDALVFIYVGSLHTSRMVYKVIKAFAQVAQSYPKARLLLVGRGDQEHHLRFLVQQQALTEQVVFTGVVPFLEVPHYMRAADVGIAYVPDNVQYKHQPPLKTVEYLASGLPVIATDTPGNRRFVVHGWNGLLVQDNPEDLARGMIQMLNQPYLREQLALVARKSVEKFSYEHIVRECLIPFYERCLSAQL
jgi:glycosyltransferase involved in cell wall biosynthesis